MIVKAIYKISETHVVGDNKKIYKLPYKLGKRNYKLKELKKYRGGFFFNLIWVDSKDIKFEKIVPYEIINTEKLLF
jgi:hypothetical protein